MSPFHDDSSAKRVAANQRTRERTAFALVDMVISMAIYAMLISICAFWIHATLKYSAKVRSYQRQHQQLTRLSSMLRQDVLECQSMTREGNQLKLGYQNKPSLVYTIEPGGATISRSRVSVDSNGKAQATSIEQFPIANSSVAGWDDSEMPDWIGLVVVNRLDNRLAPGNYPIDSMPETVTPRNDPVTADQFHRGTAVELYVRCGPRQNPGGTHE
ncbi:MAG: hypothetical protein AAFN77_16115 [Planctomycetota bacterium]